MRNRIAVFAMLAWSCFLFYGYRRLKMPPAPPQLFRPPVFYNYAAQVEWPNEEGLMCQQIPDAVVKNGTMYLPAKTIYLSAPPCMAGATNIIGAGPQATVLQVQPQFF